MNKHSLSLDPGQLKLEILRRAYFHPFELDIVPEAWKQVEAAQAVVRDKVDGGETVYGVNTGFGQLAQKHIPTDLLGELQHNLILSHATGVGQYIHEATVRLILLLKINGLLRGVSGVRREVIEFLLLMLNQNILPAIPERARWVLRAIWRHSPILACQ
jgi:histidine ammonia-lyase